LENTAWELAQEGIALDPNSETPEDPFPEATVDVLLIFDEERVDNLSDAFQLESISFRRVSTIEQAILFCQVTIPSVIFCNAKSLTNQHLKDLQSLQREKYCTWKLVSIVEEKSPFQEEIQEISEDTYLEPVEDDIFVRCVFRYKEFQEITNAQIYNSLTKKHDQGALDVLLVYDQDAIDYMTDIFDSESISSHGVLSIKDGIDFCKTRTPSVVLIDAKTLSQETLDDFHIFYKEKQAWTNIFSFLTETSPFQNEILSLSKSVFMIPVKTSIIMKCVHQNI
jgi:hypothetical protein